MLNNQKLSVLTTPGQDFIGEVKDPYTKLAGSFTSGQTQESVSPSLPQYTSPSTTTSDSVYQFTGGIDFLGRTADQRKALFLQDEANGITTEDRNQLNLDANTFITSNPGQAESFKRQQQSQAQGTLDTYQSQIGSIQSAPITAPIGNPEMKALENQRDQEALPKWGNVTDPTTGQTVFTTLPGTTPSLQNNGTSNGTSTGNELRDKLNTLREKNGQALDTSNYTTGNLSTTQTTQTPDIQKPVVFEYKLPDSATPEGVQKSLNDLNSSFSDLNLGQDTIQKVQAFSQRQDIQDLQREQAQIKAIQDAEKANEGIVMGDRNLQLANEKRSSELAEKQKQAEKDEAIKVLNDGISSEVANAESDKRVMNLLASISGQRSLGSINMEERDQALRYSIGNLKEKIQSTSAKFNGEILAIVYDSQKKMDVINGQANDKIMALKNQAIQQVNQTEQQYSDRSEKRLQYLTQITQDVIRQQNDLIKWKYTEKSKIIENATNTVLKINDMQVSAQNTAERLQFQSELSKSKIDFQNTTLALNAEKQLAPVSLLLSDASKLTGNIRSDAMGIQNDVINNLKLTPGKTLEESTISIKNRDGTFREIPVTDFNIGQELRDKVRNSLDGKDFILMENGKEGKGGAIEVKDILSTLTKSLAGIGPKFLDPSFRGGKNTEGVAAMKSINQQLMALKLSVKDGLYGLGALTGPDMDVLDAAIGVTSDAAVKELAGQNLTGVDLTGVFSTIIGGLLALGTQLERKEDVKAKTILNQHRGIVYANGLREEFVNVGSKAGKMAILKDEVNGILANTPNYNPDIVSKMYNGVVAGGQILDFGGEVTKKFREIGLVKQGAESPNSLTYEQQKELQTIKSNSTRRIEYDSYKNPLNQPGTGGAAGNI